MKQFIFFTANQYELEKKLTCQMNRVNLLHKKHSEISCSRELYELIAHNQNNPDWSISTFDTYSDAPTLLLDTQTILRGDGPHIKQDGMGIFVFHNCNGRMALEERSLEYCTRLIIANTRQKIVVDSHLQVAISEINTFFENDLKQLSDYLKKYNVNLRDPETNISVIYGPKPDYLVENEYSLSSATINAPPTGH